MAAQFPLGSAALAVAAVVTTAVPSLRQALIDVRGAGGRLEPWRWVTGHLVHAGQAHLALNLALFVPLAVRRELRAGTVRFLLEFGVLAIAVSGGVRLLHGGWESYCGLSGVVYGLLAQALLCAERRPPLARLGGDARWRGVRAAIFAVLAAKTALELSSGGWLYARGGLEEAFGVAYLAGSHAAGLAAGALLAYGAYGAAASCSGAAASHEERKARTAAAGSAASRMPPIIAAPAAPRFRSAPACSGSMPPRA